MPRMAGWTTGRWNPDTSTRDGAQRITPIAYQAYVPDPIRKLDLLFPASLVQELSRAEAAIAELEHSAAATGFPTLRQLAMLEGLGSGRLSGLVTSPRRLAEVLGGHNRRDLIAQQVASIATATELVFADSAARRIGTELLETMHAAVLGSESSRISVRSRQIWAGTSRTPRAAEYVPPPPARLADLVDDLCEFLNRTDVPPVAQAAIGHAQFLTICPFFDGNGRTGRWLVHAVLRRHGLIGAVIPPVSAIRASSRRVYYEELARYRESQFTGCCATFAADITKAAIHAARLGEQCQRASLRWRAKLGHVRSGSAAERLLRVIFDQPVLDAKQAQSGLSVSDEAARLGLLTLERAGIIRRVGASPYDRLWMTEDALDLLERWEYGLESGD